MFVRSLSINRPHAWLVYTNPDFQGTLAAKERRREAMTTVERECHCVFYHAQDICPISSQREASDEDNYIHKII